MHCTPRVLTIASVVLGAISMTVLALSVGTDSWLYTREQLKTDGGNLTSTIPIKMGLWKVCTIVEDDNAEDIRPCLTVGGGVSGQERADGQGTTFAIMSATRFAALFPVFSLVLLTIAVILGIIGNLKQDVRTLFASVISVLAGLSLAVGITLYISAINDEVGHRSKEKDGKAEFTYDYGWSFYFAGIAFILSESTAVVYITLYMRRNSSADDMVRIIPGLEDILDSNTSEKEENLGVSNPTIIL
ncbi:hypothetical protein CHS0354_024572 [Potamilus streckersoni]|uniref:Uncharacterized protein n=1 Tax=Potamilus streckersoni TaxID=2493646 RepID=A0AAE0VVR5_9BIVA|nr:hypothetical protein CHS0354_024572 [Potamilus streckersoni]